MVVKIYLFHPGGANLKGLTLVPPRSVVLKYYWLNTYLSLNHQAFYSRGQIPSKRRMNFWCIFSTDFTISSKNLDRRDNQNHAQWTFFKDTSSKFCCLLLKNCLLMLRGFNSRVINLISKVWQKLGFSLWVTKYCGFRWHQSRQTLNISSEKSEILDTNFKP